jgi:hypothetical protein
VVTGLMQAALLSPVAPLEFEGEWRLERVLTDRVDRQQLRAFGTAVITPLTDTSLTWVESGVLDTGGQQVSFRRHLTLAATAAATWWVNFSDGRPFHPFVLDQELRHHCGQDLYLGRITRPTARTTWKTVWHAHGPRKDFTSTTIYYQRPHTRQSHRTGLPL